MPPVKYHYGEFPPKTLEWPRLIPLLGPASYAIAQYDALLKAIPNPEVLLSPLVTQEAVLSSQIEGTIATMAEVLEYEAGLEQELESRKQQDIHEIINYRKAIKFAEELLKTIPLTGRLIKESHAKLLEGVRGEGKDRGNFRTNENWIGPPGCTKDNAKFIPIEPQNLMEGISEWEKYLHSDQPDVLVQLGIVHAEFEALHPFYDGNGRMGRMLLPLYLYSRKLLTSPTFYMSAYFETHRAEYYERLLAISRDNDWSGWCEFFLTAINEQANLNTNKAKEIMDLYGNKKDWVAEKTHSQHAIKTLDFLFGHPVFAGSEFVNNSGIPVATAKRILGVLQKGELVKVLKKSSGRRPAILVFPELINITEGRKLF